MVAATVDYNGEICYEDARPTATRVNCSMSVAVWHNAAGARTELPLMHTRIRANGGVVLVNASEAKQLVAPR